MSPQAHVWQRSENAAQFLDEVRAAIPFAQAQIDIMLDLLETGRPVQRLLDVGCGDGALIAAVRSRYPQAEAIGVDFSQTMLEAARKRFGEEVTLHCRDLNDPQWASGLGGFDAVVSAYAIHHCSDDRKCAVYRDIHAMLNPGGWFVNIEHVASVSSLGQQLFDGQFIDAMHGRLLERDPSLSHDQVREDYQRSDEKAANILASVEDQCGWLRRIGYEHVDCYFKCYELAVFAGRHVGAQPGL